MSVTAVCSCAGGTTVSSEESFDGETSPDTVLSMTSLPDVSSGGASVSWQPVHASRRHKTVMQNNIFFINEFSWRIVWLALPIRGRQPFRKHILQKLYHNLNSMSIRFLSRSSKYENKSYGNKSSTKRRFCARKASKSSRGTTFASSAVLVVERCCIL